MEIDYLFEISPSLRTGLEAGIASETKRAIRVVIRDLEGYGELDAAGAARARGATYTADQILGDWLPPEPAPPDAKYP